MKDLGSLSLQELTAYVQSALSDAGIPTVLSGGSCVSVWSDGAYVSDDIDLIPEGIGQRQKIKKVMTALGFIEQRRYFVRPDTKLWFEFPNGPLAVGEEPPKDVLEMKTRVGTLRILSATDCVKDRLTWWFHDQDRQCLEQAVAVAKANKINLKELNRWARGEGAQSAYDAFKLALDDHA